MRVEGIFLVPRYLHHTTTPSARSSAALPGLTNNSEPGWETVACGVRRCKGGSEGGRKGGSVRVAVAVRVPRYLHHENEHVLNLRRRTVNLRRPERARNEGSTREPSQAATQSALYPGLATDSLLSACVATCPTPRHPQRATRVWPRIHRCRHLHTPRQDTSSLLATATSRRLFSTCTRHVTTSPLAAKRHVKAPSAALQPARGCPLIQSRVRWETLGCS